MNKPTSVILQAKFLEGIKPFVFTCKTWVLLRYSSFARKTFVVKNNFRIEEKQYFSTFTRERKVFQGDPILLRENASEI